MSLLDDIFITIKKKNMKRTRRKFIKNSGQFALGVGLFGMAACGSDGGNNATDNETTKEEKPELLNGGELFFNISLAQWSLHKALGFRGTKTLDNLDFAAKARNDFGISGVEYVNQFFGDKAKDMEYLKQMNQRAADNDVTQLLIMIDNEGGLAEIEDKKRTEAIENHYKWVDAAKFLGCHSIRVNAFSESESAEEAAKAAVDGLGRLAEYAKQANINVIVENHGGFSSNGAWLKGVMNEIGMENCGTLPDFGNFCIRREGGNPWEGECIEEYDRYLGTEELMVHAKAVSAKTFDFNKNGDETLIDYMKMMKIVKDADYTGFVGIEYEGSTMSEEDGIRATKALLEKVGKALS
ncbi:MAG: sugar phosphate isomerase/epimerase [Saprospiraceae bacterium]